MGERLYNGIELNDEWPPRNIPADRNQAMRVPYLERKPEVIDIDLGRQLFVDDFLVANTNLTFHYHQPVKCPMNPLFFPEKPWEMSELYGPTCIPKCGGIWYDDLDGFFKMWYLSSYTGNEAYAISKDGLHWERPELDIVPGTNLLFPEGSIRPDSGTAWIDFECENPEQRYKLLIREVDTVMHKQGNRGARMMTSRDGIYWSKPVLTSDMDDRSTMFKNRFRGKWIQSIRGYLGTVGRCRYYWEHSDFLPSGNWSNPPFWACADCFDQGNELNAQLYNLDANSYESLMVGFYQIFRGPENHVGRATGQPKLTELVLATSRDGFHWHRPDRRSFIGANRRPGFWDNGYVEATGGILLVVGDELWIYYSAYGGDETCTNMPDWCRDGMYSNGAVGLAKLRRDGFASLHSSWHGGYVRTRNVRFSGGHLFVNANTVGTRLTVAVMDESGKIIPGFEHENCTGFLGNSVKAPIAWKTADLATLAGRVVQFDIRLNRGDLYAFWVSQRSTGESGGYLAAGGPGYKNACDK